MIAPLRLTAYARGGAFVNAEWLPSPAALFPLLYVTMAVRRDRVSRRARASAPRWRFVVFALLALSRDRARAQSGTLLRGDADARRADGAARAASHRAVALLALLPIGWAYANGPHVAGIDGASLSGRARRSVIHVANLQGNIYNPDQFGGYLIWTFYPQRRALTDGRNELYHAFIAEYAKARLDSRAWHALIAKYRIDLAVDEYRPPLDVVESDERTTSARCRRRSPTGRGAIGRSSAMTTSRWSSRGAQHSRRDDQQLEAKGIVPVPRRSNGRYVGAEYPRLARKEIAARSAVRRYRVRGVEAAADLIDESSPQVSRSSTCSCGQRWPGRARSAAGRSVRSVARSRDEDRGSLCARNGRGIAPRGATRCVSLPIEIVRQLDDHPDAAESAALEKRGADSPRRFHCELAHASVTAVKRRGSRRSIPLDAVTARLSGVLAVAFGPDLVGVTSGRCCDS